MTKLSKNAKTLLASLRDAAFGATMVEDGNRWSKTDASYAEHAVGRSGQTLDVSILAFDALVVELISAGLVRRDPVDSFVFVQLPSLLKESDMFDVSKASMAELVAKYNQLNPSTPVKRFADRKTAERRVNAALDGAGPDDSTLEKAEPAPEKVVAKAPAPSPLPTPATAAPIAPKSAPAPAAPRAPGVSREGERFVRNHVKVDGVEFRSVAKAFQELRLPMAKHIKFRAALKQAGAKDFEAGGKTYHFNVV